MSKRHSFAVLPAEILITFFYTNNIFVCDFSYLQLSWDVVK